MTVLFHPISGQVALIEPQDIPVTVSARGGTGSGDGSRGGSMTGVVAVAGDDTLEIIGVSWSELTDLADGAEVIVSIFAPEALFRLHAAARWGLSGRLSIHPIHDVERIQRRRWPRHPLRFEVMLTPHDGADIDLASVAGRTLDLGIGGLRVETIDRLPPGADATVNLTLPDGLPLVARTTVVCADFTDDGCEYRLVFDHLEQFDARRLTALVDQGSDTVPF
jgi:PilZ domain